MFTLENNVRGLRYYFLPVLFDLLFFYELDRFVRDNTIGKIKDLAVIALILLDIFTIQKFRMTSTGLLLCLLLFITFVRTKRQYKLVYLVIGIIALAIIINIPFVQNIISAIGSGNDPYLATRSNGRAWYFAAVANHPLFGCGYPTISNIASYQASGAHLGILLNDNGIIGFLYMYGIVGIVWLIIH